MLVVNGKTEIAWTDLEASSSTQGMAWDVLTRDGDSSEASGAQFSHDGTKLVYSSGSNINSGVTLSDGTLRIVPWNARKGGTSLLVAGASDPNFNQFYPTFSPDDKWLAFNRLPHGSGSYNNSQSEVYVLPASGGTGTRLSANDPPMCSGKTSPGVTNSWPKWSPNVTTVGTRSYYWLTFSSTRGDMGNPQLYVTPVVVEGGKVTTYPALYLWNQPANQSNHTPAWDNFQIPIG
jgi:hypothetical protein